MRHSRLLLAALMSATLAGSVHAKDSASFYLQGIDLYKAGRYSEAVDQFELAIKTKDNSASAQNYIDRIRKETVERIRNKALTGVNKSNWQNKYYFMNQVDGRVRVGISAQELFERDSINFRPGALDALTELAKVISRAENAKFDIELVNEMNLDTQVNDPKLVSQQLTTLFSYLSLAARDVAPKF